MSSRTETILTNILNDDYSFNEPQSRVEDLLVELGTKISNLNKPDVTLTFLRKNYSPNGTSWSDESDINFENGQFIEIKIDSIGSNEKEELIGIGEYIQDWYQGDRAIHLYTNKVSDDMCELYIDVTGNDTKSQSMITVSGPITLKLNKNGFYINNAIYYPEDNVEIYNTNISSLISMSNMKIGSLEGTNRSTSHYVYIRIGQEI